MGRFVSGFIVALVMTAALGAAPARAEVVFDLPDGKTVNAETMAKALIEAIETASPDEKPLLMQALAHVLEMAPKAQISDTSSDEKPAVY